MVVHEGDYRFQFGSTAILRIPPLADIKASTYDVRRLQKTFSILPLGPRCVVSHRAQKCWKDSEMGKMISTAGRGLSHPAFVGINMCHGEEWYVTFARNHRPVERTMRLLVTPIVQRLSVV
jgi:hypothetical protein